MGFCDGEGCARGIGEFGAGDLRDEQPGGEDVLERHFVERPRADEQHVLGIVPLQFLGERADVQDRADEHTRRVIARAQRDRAVGRRGDDSRAGCGGVFKRRVPHVEAVDPFALPLATEDRTRVFLPKFERLVDRLHRMNLRRASGQCRDHARGRAQHVEHDARRLREVAFRQARDLGGIERGVESHRFAVSPRGHVIRAW